MKLTLWSLPIWLIIFLLPIAIAYIENGEVSWLYEIYTLKDILLYFAVFLAHGLLLIPFLYNRKRYAAYGVCVLVLMGGSVYCWQNAAPRPRPRYQPEVERQERGRLPTPPPSDSAHNMPPPTEGQAGTDSQPPSGESRNEGQPRTVRPHRADKNRADRGGPQKEQREGNHRNNRRNNHKEERREQHPNRLPFLNPILTLHIVIEIMMLLLQLSAAALFANYQKKRQRELEERENALAQLDYLRYQISPHFFMNTLNNIHALVDIDPEACRQTIQRLSGLMRYLLYESAAREVPLRSEIKFIRSFVELMTIRYTDNVKISLNLPDEENVDTKETIAPLLFICFIENAFKHGVSYLAESQIDIELTSKEDGTVNFVCRNLKVPQRNDSVADGGLGLKNLRNRLEILYPKRHTLTIDDNGRQYTAALTIRTESNTQTARN